mmetsp:Transcript_43289/g.169454  ORF Transcript_43289/g.169454 Transcript_43289/m.169454 type:complete len:114 (+) Transcript_43289:3250-3591(+)
MQHLFPKIPTSSRSKTAFQEAPFARHHLNISLEGDTTGARRKAFAHKLKRYHESGLFQIRIVSGTARWSTRNIAEVLALVPVADDIIVMKKLDLGIPEWLSNNRRTSPHSVAR